MKPAPVFFSERAFAAIEGKQPLEQLRILSEMISQAEHDKAAGYGPPRDEIDIVLRRFNRIFNHVHRGKAA